MKKIEVIYQQGEHQWAVVARDPDKAGYVIDTNEYLVSYRGESLLTDPGGMEIFPAVFAALSQEVDISSIRYLFASHQDPDIISSLALWLEVNPDLRCYLSWLWESFVPHFGGNDSTFISIPDEGMELNLNGLALQAMVPPAEDTLYVENFDRHIRHAEGFHRRWMGSNQAKLDWCERVAKMKIDMMCPQHGSIYQGGDIERFINWFAELPVGSGVRVQQEVADKSVA